ncbi:hypothetical protein WR25_00565 [Diploscapter pachys]|uniref:Uncharacterized protein n=1 Tax=Diploscapter pachys TaxID=2018661 RepID=A0A2A2KWQ2_9BILA|nr:hypothetical protein WR25_00565 [Diploscapter pachys]
MYESILLFYLFILGFLLMCFVIAIHYDRSLRMRYENLMRPTSELHIQLIQVEILPELHIQPIQVEIPPELHIQPIQVGIRPDHLRNLPAASTNKKRYGDETDCAICLEPYVISAFFLS